MSRRYLAALALAACLVLAVGLFVRHGLLAADAPAAAAPPSEASPLQQLSQGGQLRRTAEYLAERTAMAAPLVEYLPGVGASGVRWAADTVISTRAGHPVVAVPAARADSARPAAIPAADSARPAWVVLVGRGADGAVVSTAGLAGGRVRTRCATREVEEYLVGVPLHESLAGAGAFDLDGRLLGVVVRCGDRLAAIPVRQVARLLADAGAPPRRVRDAYGFVARALDGPARASFAPDSGLVVTEVRRGGPAEAAGLRPGDLIVAVDGEPSVADPDLARLTAGAATDTHTVTRRRGGSAADVRIASAGDAPSAPAAPTAGSAAGELGIDLTAAAPPRGVAVTAVRPGSPAAAAGLRPGDRLLRVGDAPVTSSAVARRLLAGAAGAPTFIVFERDSVERGVLVPR